MGYDPLEETIRVRMVQDEIQREQLPTIGYYAFFEYINGFKKAIYWSKKKMLKHADKYSQAFSAGATKKGQYSKVSFEDYEAGNYDPKTSWLYSSFWYKDFDGMAHKTMLRQLISKWGIMSIEMQKAFDSDMSLVKEDGSYEYVDTPQNSTSEPAEPAGTVIDVDTGEIKDVQDSTGLTDEDKAEIMAQEAKDAQDDFFNN